MGAPYTEVTVTNYNLNPPTDDGAQTPTNEITWAKHKTKLSDPLKTAIEAVDDNAFAAFGKIAGGVTSLADDYTVLAGDQGLLLVQTVAAKTFTTPDATVVTEPFRFWVLNASSGDLTLDGSGSQTIDGALTVTVPKGRGLMIETDGTNWKTDGQNWPESVVVARPMSPPTGRLTLTTGVPVLASDVSGATTVYFTPYGGASIWLYDGTNWRAYTFAELSQTLADTTKSPAAAIANTCYDLFAWLDTATVRCTRGPKWSKTATITMTIAAPGVVTWTGHGLGDGMVVRFTTTGALPTGIAASTDYFVTKVDANTFKLSTTLANQVAGTFITTTGTQSGVHTGENSTTDRGTGAGTSELARVNGVLMNANAITNGAAASRGVYVGTIATDGSAQLNMQCAPAAAAGGGGNRLDVWNNYNRRQVSALSRDSTDSWPYTLATWRPANGNAGNRVTAVFGLNEDAVQAAYQAAGSVTSTSLLSVGVGLDSTSAFSGLAGFAAPTGTGVSALLGTYVGRPGAGVHSFPALEYATAAGTTTWYGDNGAATVTQTGLSLQAWM